MKCPFCGHLRDKVVDSRETKDGTLIRRRRQCLSCERRFTSYERIEEIQFMVIKKGGQRETFDRQKLLTGIMASCQKRPVRMADCQEIVNDVMAQLYEKPEREIDSREIGEIVMRSLKGLDTVAYIRFASVYREFQDVSDFLEQVGNLAEKKKK